jgi:hypothetical protein
METKPKNKLIFSRRIKFLVLATGLVIVLLLVATIILVGPDQLKTNVVPDPMAYFQTQEAAGRDAHALIKEQHAAVWIVRRSAFLPIPDVTKVPRDLRDSAKVYNDEMRGRLESATAGLLVANLSQGWDRMHPLRAAFSERSSSFPKQADYLNAEFQQVWRDFCMTLSSLQGFRADGRPDHVTFLGPDRSKLEVSDNFGSRVVPRAAELPEEIAGMIAEWRTVMAKISSSLLEAPAEFGDHSYSDSARRLKDIDKAHESTLDDFLPRFMSNDEFIILPCGIESWFETRSRAELALCASKEQWIRAAWTCHDDLRDNRQFAHYLKKAGLKGRLILAQESLEDKASDWAESIEDIVEDAVR